MLRAALVVGATLVALPASAQTRGDLYAPSAWDLSLGTHASDLPVDQFVHYSCGTNGGPPSIPLTGWVDFERCRPEAATGLREVYFQYDNELEYIAKARGLETQAALHQYTSAYEIPIIVSALFEEHGFLVGVRIVADPRVEATLREKGGLALTNFLRARYGEEGWTCEELAHLPGERPYLGFHVKRHCTRTDADTGLSLLLDTHNYRKPGQSALDPVLNLETAGQFETSTRLEFTLTAGIPDAEQRLAILAARGAPEPTEKDLLIARAMNCPGCDLAGVDLKRANLAGANLAGANLSGANLHEANLANANLAGANLANANINHAIVRLADLSGANLRNAMVFETRFDGANLSGADLRGLLAASSHMPRANLTGAVMIDGDLRNTRLNDANFTDADLTGTWFDDAQITRTDFTGATLAGAIMWGVNLANAKLVGANLREADLIRADLRGADLSGADFTGARLTFANLADTITTGAVWPADFEPR